RVSKKLTHRCHRKIQGYTGKYREIQRNTGIYRDIQGYTGIYREIQGYTGKYRDIQGNTKKYRDIQGYTGKYREIQGNTEDTHRDKEKRIQSKAEKPETDNNEDTFCNGLGDTFDSLPAWG
ncbi:MAG: hypothetical protein ACQESL_02175, partial [Bacteroidota bacterium]